MDCFQILFQTIAPTSSMQCGSPSVPLSEPLSPLLLDTTCNQRVKLNWQTKTWKTPFIVWSPPTQPPVPPSFHGWSILTILCLHRYCHGILDTSHPFSFLGEWDFCALGSRLGHKTQNPASTCSSWNKIWKSTKEFPRQNESTKLSLMYIGPFEVLNITKPNVGCLKLPWTLRVHPVFNVCTIKPVSFSPLVLLPHPPPPPRVIDYHPVFTVYCLVTTQWHAGVQAVEWILWTSGPTIAHLGNREEVHTEGDGHTD